jgi:urease accessory protein
MPAATAHTPTLLQLMWLASPALPVGGFSYSEGLESAVECGLVHDEHSASRWLQDQLLLGVLRSEWAAVMRAHAAFVAQDPGGAQAVNDWVLHTRETRELRLQAEQMGRSMAEWLLQRHPHEPRVHALRALHPAPSWPVAFALAGVLAGAQVADVLMAHGFSWAENQVQAAIKCIPLGQSAGQRVLQQLSHALPGALRSRLEMPADEGQAYTPGLAIHSARHEQQYSRLFRS